MAMMPEQALMKMLIHTASDSCERYSDEMSMDGRTAGRRHSASLQEPDRSAKDAALGRVSETYQVELVFA